MDFRDFGSWMWRPTKTSLICKLPCLLKLPPTILECLFLLDLCVQGPVSPRKLRRFWNRKHYSQLPKGGKNPTDKWINKLYIHTIEYYLVFKKSEILTTCYSMNETWKHNTKWHKPDTKGPILYDFYRVRQIHKENRLEDFMGLGETCWGLMITGLRVSTWDDKNILEINTGNDCTTQSIWLIPVNYTPEMIKIGNFMLYMRSDN